MILPSDIRCTFHLLVLHLHFITTSHKYTLDGSERGKIFLTQLGFYAPLAQILPPLFIGTSVQCINMPLVRSTITIQNPESQLKVFLLFEYIHM